MLSSTPPPRFPWLRSRKLRLYLLAALLLSVLPIGSFIVAELIVYGRWVEQRRQTSKDESNFVPGMVVWTESSDDSFTRSI